MCVRVVFLVFLNVLYAVNTIDLKFGGNIFTNYGTQPLLKGFRSTNYVYGYM